MIGKARPPQSSIRFSAMMLADFLLTFKRGNAREFEDIPCDGVEGASVESEAKEIFRVTAALCFHAFLPRFRNACTLISS